MKAVISAGLLFFFSSFALADIISEEELRSIQRKIKSSPYLSVEMTQTKISPTRPNRPVVSQGHAKFAKPDKFLWSVGDPINEDTIFNGKQLVKVRPKDKVAVRYPASGNESQELRNIVDLVLSMDNLLNRYSLKRAEQKGSIIEVQLGPKSVNEIDQVDLKLDVKNNFISFLKLQLKNKMVLSIDFKNPSTAPIALEFFEVPAGVKLNDVK